MRKKSPALLGVIVIVLGLVGFFVIHVVSGPSLTPAQIAARAAAARARKLIAAEKKAVHIAGRALTVTLPTKAHAAAPATPTALFTQPLGSREVVGFVPYYSLGQLTSSDFADTSALCYFGIQLNKGAMLDEPSRFVGLDTASFATFLTSAHAANDQVLLTISAFSKPVIDSIARHPSESAARLISEVSPLVMGHDLQGIDLDIEGRWPADRKGFTQFVQHFATAFRALDPTGVIVLDTFPQSAASPHDFFNLKQLSPMVDNFFIMAYAMQSATNASANSPAFSPSLGLSSVQTLIQYTKVVKPSKLLLGLPFYGYDFATASARPGALTTSSNPVAVTYDAVLGVHRAAFWDPVSETPYNEHRVGTQWHETWYDNPLSIAIKVALARNFHTAGTGVWTLGMEGADTAMLSALDGDSPPVKTSLAGAGTSG